jgi:hypothetical protein
MKIDFNPSRIPKPELDQPVVRQAASATASVGASSSAAASLQSKFNDIPMVRPEMVDHAKTLVSSNDYPPGYMVDRIAALLAEHINK